MGQRRNNKDRAGPATSSKCNNDYWNTGHVRLVKFEPYHLEGMRGRLNDIHYAICDDFDQIKAAILSNAQRGKVESIFAGGMVIGLLGCVKLFDGVGESWALLTNDIYRYPKAVTKIARSRIDSIMDEMDLHRVQSLTIAADSRALKWLLHLGFKEEGIMNKYGPQGQDFVRVARWK